VFAGERLGQLVHVPVQEIDKLHHDTGAALRVGGGPAKLCFSGIGDCGVHLGLAGERDLRLNFACCRIVDVGVAARRAFDMLAVDKVTDFLHFNLSR